MQLTGLWYLYPIQVGLEQLEAGLERAVHSVRLHLEVHTGHLVAKLDVKNAFNSLDRRVVLTRMNEVPGVPYVAGSLQCKTRDIIAKMELVDRRLRLAHLQSMWVVLRFCLTPLADYWVRLSYPTDTAELASAVDAKLQRSVDRTELGIEPNSQS